MRIDLKRLVNHLKTCAAGKVVSVRFVDRLPKDEHGDEWRGDATDYGNKWRIRIHKKLTLQEQIDTIIHEFAHVVRGIPSRKDPHDAKFHECLGIVSHWVHQYLGKVE